jgi:Sulfotransferase family
MRRSEGTEPALDGRLPNLVIAGVAKAGTTSLFTYLAQHPDICGADVKELRYFTALGRGGQLKPIEEYTRHFRGCTGSRYAMEATPEYFHGGRALARGLRETCPDVHVVVSLRSPAERCWSWFRFVKNRLRLPKDVPFDEYLDRCEELRAAGSDAARENYAYWGLGAGCYDEWLDDWRDEFGDRFRVIFFEDLVRDPAGVVRDVCAWLGLDTAVVDDFVFDAENTAVQYRAERLQRLAMAVNRRGEALLNRHPAVKRRIRSAYYRVNRQPSQDVFSPAARERLAEFYRPHNERLARQLTAAGIAHPAWLEQSSPRR